MNFEKSGIIAENPYQNANNNVCLELIQLLLVVEKIKASKVGMNVLESLVSLHNFLRGQESIREYLPWSWHMSRTPEAEADEIFSTVCLVLDTKQQPSLKDFFIAANLHLNQFRGISNQPPDKQAMERQEKFWLTIAPELINEHGYDFKSLQNDALGYSHLSIVYAYKETARILDVIEKLRNIDDSKIIEEAIEKYANEIQLDRSSVFKKSEHSIHFRHQINQKICDGFGENFFQQVKFVKRLFAIDSTPYENYSLKVTIEKEEYEHILYKTEACDVVTIKLPREAFNRAKDSGTAMLLNRVILTRIWDAVNEQSSFRSYVDERYHLENLPEYSYWASNQNETLLNIELSKGRKLSISAMMRGLKFSYWFYSEKAKQQKRLNIGDAVKLYVKEKGLQDSATTVKFSFEAIKRVAKTELAPLICKQLFWRLNNDFPSVRYSFCPLNDSFYQKVKYTVFEIKNILDLQVDIENYSSLLEKIVQIEKLLRNDDRENCRDSEQEISLQLGYYQDDKINRRRLEESIKHKHELFTLKPLNK
ncbi:hypothetical protein D0Z62_06380 [Providencia rettgeri]|uniref:hypothetical protein n=1 Tax=Providencia rettgeri TaxID=587 RepID=UPI001011A943|nr:hypothetical protein [Providencia rettgeri]RXN73438.1 hypothetical protein D0Z62_06380 [Providencia rettgeri]